MIAVVRSARHTQELRALGAWHVIDTTVSSLRETALDLTHSEGATAAIDSIGGADGTELVHCTCRRGAVLSVGLLSGVPADLSIVRDRNVVAKPSWLRQWVQDVSVDEWQSTFRNVMELVGKGRLKMASIAARYDLRDAKEAVREADRPGRSGKVALQVRSRH